MIDVMTRLKVHHMAEGGAAQAVIAAKCGISLRSVERMLREPEPTREEVAQDERANHRGPGRPRMVADDVLDRIRVLVTEEPSIAATEVLRRARGWGYRGSRSTMAALVKELRPVPRKEAIIRFEGLPGEYAQFDFGEAKVTYEDGRKDKLIFWAARLKYSRFMHVLVVRDQTAETLARSLVASLVAFGGAPKEWVFDNPKTVRISPIGVQPPVLHAYLRDLVAEYRVIPTLCTPGKGQQKGSVERLVKFVKYSFFFARKFRDRADAEAPTRRLAPRGQPRAALRRDRRDPRRRAPGGDAVARRAPGPHDPRCVDDAGDGDGDADRHDLLRGDTVLRLGTSNRGAGDAVRPTERGRDRGRRRAGPPPSTGRARRRADAALAAHRPPRRGSTAAGRRRPPGARRCCASESPPGRS